MTLSVLAVVGRPNVGKSTLVNRIAGRRIAISEGEPGITRDRLEVDASWCGRRFLVVDTGGFVTGGMDAITSKVVQQSEAAVRSADVLVFLTDGRAGVTPGDIEVADFLRKSRKPVYLVVNKIDTPAMEPLVSEFFALGFGEPVGISAEHGRNVGDLLDMLVERFPRDDGERDSASVTATGVPQAVSDADARTQDVKVAIVGRPNVGKSSTVNAVLGEERLIVSDIPGTTRDAVDTPVTFEGRRLVLIDTAGLRRQGKLRTPMERYSVARARKAVSRSDVAVVLLDATQPVADQDKAVVQLVVSAGTGLILALNKWDLAGTDVDPQAAERALRSELVMAKWAPLVLLSAKTGYGLTGLLKTVIRVGEVHRSWVERALLRETLTEAMEAHEPPHRARKGGRLRLLGASQTATSPPLFSLVVNNPTLAETSYLRYLENRLRQKLDLEGTPVLLKLEKGGR